MGMRVFVGVGVCVPVGVFAAGSVDVPKGVVVGSVKRDVEQPARQRREIVTKENLIAFFKTPHLALEEDAMIILGRKCPYPSVLFRRYLYRRLAESRAQS